MTKLDQRYVFVPTQVKDCYLFSLLEEYLDNGSAIIFTSTCKYVRLAVASPYRELACIGEVLCVVWPMYARCICGTEVHKFRASPWFYRAGFAREEARTDSRTCARCTCETRPLANWYSSAYRAVVRLMYVLPQPLAQSPTSLLHIDRGCESLSLMLRELGIENTPLHSKMPQNERLASLAKFRSSIVKVLVATDVASRCVG